MTTKAKYDDINTQPTTDPYSTGPCAKIKHQNELYSQIFFYIIANVIVVIYPDKREPALISCRGNNSKYFLIFVSRGFSNFPIFRVSI